MTSRIAVKTTRAAYRVKIPEHHWASFIEFMRETRSPGTLNHRDLSATFPKAMGRGKLREDLEHFFDGIADVSFE